MNERIRELADQAGVSITAADKNGVFTLLPDKQKKFAELIVRECAKIAADGGDTVTSFCISDHFGVD